jgi:hypothetical protein
MRSEPALNSARATSARLVQRLRGAQHLRGSRKEFANRLNGTITEITRIDNR